VSHESEAKVPAMMGRVNPPANDWFDGIDELAVRELRLDRPSALPDHPLNYALGQKTVRA
jgi:hypothetical protein